MLSRLHPRFSFPSAVPGLTQALLPRRLLREAQPLGRAPRWILLREGTSVRARGSRIKLGFNAAIRFVLQHKKDIHGGKRGCVAGNNIEFVLALPQPGKFTETLRREGLNSFF